MMEEHRADELEEKYGMPPGRLMYHLYHERALSAAEIANELDVDHRNTVKYWLQRSGIKMRSRTLTDTQRILMISLLAAGVGRRTISEKVGCGAMTVYRYRNDLVAALEPVDIDTELSPVEYDVLCRMIEEDIAGSESIESSPYWVEEELVESDESTKHTSNCTVDSD